MRDDLKPSVVLRLATVADEHRVQTLAQLDSAPVPTGEVLIAEVEGRLEAALPLDGSEPIADPFRRTADLVALLQARAAQLGGGGTSLSALERRSTHVRSAKPLAALRRLA